MNKLLLGLVTVGLASVVVGCGARAADEEEEIGSSTTTSALQISRQGGVSEDVLEIDETTPTTPSDAAAWVASRPLRRLSPAGCATKTRVGDTVRIELHGCTGPFGQVTLDGTVEAQFSTADDGRLHIDVLAGADFTANGTPRAYHGSADVRFTAGARDVEYHGDASGETKRGRHYERHTDATLSLDLEKHCVTLAGVSKGTIGKYEIDVAVDDFAVCEGACPTSGHITATIAGRVVGERTMEVAFDGGDLAHVKGFRGRRFDVQMACEDGEAVE